MTKSVLLGTPGRRLAARIVLSAEAAGVPWIIGNTTGAWVSCLFLLLINVAVIEGMIWFWDHTEGTEP